MEETATCPADHEGFTLIELSIVLVIIGLIVGGVLVGRNLIKAAEIRAQIKQFDSYAVAMQNFELKYNCLPGDCRKASDYGLGSNGNGNGILEYDASSLTTCWWIYDNNRSSPDCLWNGEFPLFFQHLSAAEMIEGNYDGTWELGKGYPKVAINESTGMMVAGGWGSSSSSTKPDYLSRDYGFPDANGFWLHAKICDPSQSEPDYADECQIGIFTPLQMQQIDTKIDDGKPLSGMFWGYTASSDNAPGPPEASCLTDDDSRYNLSTSLAECLAAYRLN